MDILRERSIVLAIATQLFVALFSAFLTIGLVGLYDPESIQGFPESSVAYIGPGGFDTYLDDAQNLGVVALDDVEDALEGFRGGRFLAVVEETYDAAGGARTVSILLPEGEITTTLVVTQFKDLLRDYERDLRLERQDRLDQQVLYAETEADPNPYFGFVYTALLPLLVLTPVFLAGAITGDSMTQEIESRTLTLLRASPLSPAEFVLGKLLVPVLLVPAQVLLWIVLILWNGIPVHNIGPILLLATLMGAILSGVNAAVAVLVKREGVTQAAYTIIALFLSLVAFLLPQDPLNLLARMGVGSMDTASWTTLGAYAALAVATLAGTFAFVGRRIRQDAV
jgi:ABC-type Na+ efflux pump permease subunit